ncbi:MAG: preprotein translocase subunit SecE [Oscillospiraceae bacterium]|nr:preprotein translocase subunit SecE [Oscillospiraceae bacterium]
MADEKITQAEQSTAKAAAKKKKAKKPNRIAKWFREMKSELKKVVWPSGKQIFNNTCVALVCMVVSAIGIWLFDWLASQGVRALISLGG